MIMERILTGIDGAQVSQEGWQQDKLDKLGVGIIWLICWRSNHPNIATHITYGNAHAMSMHAFHGATAPPRGTGISDGSD